MMAGAGASPYELASDAASRLGIAVGAEELATLASDLDLGDGEMAAVAATFSYLAEKRRLASIETLLYSPELKFYSNRVKMDTDLNTSIHNLHCLGDASGWTRGLMMASCMGVLMGRKLAEQENA